MYVDHSQIALTRPGGDPLKNEFLSPGDIQEDQIFGRGANKDEIVVLGIIQRDQAAAFYSKLLIEENKNAIELMDRQHLPNPGVMIQNERSRVRCRVEIPHAGLRPAHKVPIAEDHPRLL